jgi:hypothetical protein
MELVLLLAQLALATAGAVIVVAFAALQHCGRRPRWHWVWYGVACAIVAGTVLPAIMKLTLR